MRFIRFRILSKKLSGTVYKVEQEGVVQYDETIGGDCIAQLMQAYQFDRWDIVELETKESYGYLKFKLKDGVIVPEGPITYTAKN